MACGAEVIGPEASCSLEDLEREVDTLDSEARVQAAKVGRFSVCTNLLANGMCPRTAVVNPDGQVGLKQLYNYSKWSRRSI